MLFDFLMQGHYFDTVLKNKQTNKITISSWVSNMFLHKTAESRKVCGHTGNAHHSTFSCQKKQTKSVSGQYVLNDFTLREKKEKRAALKMTRENYYAFLWILRKRTKRRKKKWNFKEKILHCEISLMFPSS